jgi:hypothetical protein
LHTSSLFIGENCKSQIKIWKNKRNYELLSNG